MHRLDGRSRSALAALVKEGCNNVLKHSARKAATLAYREWDDKLEVSLENQGGGSESLVPGFGLRSLRWRASLVGGSFQATVSPQGVRLKLILPLL